MKGGFKEFCENAFCDLFWIEGIGFGFRMGYFCGKVGKHCRTAGKAAPRGIYEINSGGKAQSTKKVYLQ